MSKHIIIDWQRDGLFVAMGSRRGSSVVIETLVNTGGEGGASGSSTAISTQLFALAKQLDLHKSEATVIAPREVLEFRTLTVPRGDANEVPDMVRFQAQRQMANIGDTWPLDYILLPDQAGQEGISALAATISPAHMAEIEATCSDLGIQLTRVLARPVEIARWGVAVGNLASTEAALIIAVSQTHADLLLVSYGSLVQVRGTRLPEDQNVMAATLVAEIRRSVMAASTFVNNHSVSRVLIIAAPELAERVEASIAQATQASVAIVDPASLLPASLPERHELAQRAANRLASIAGVLSSASPDKRDVIDLKNFKRREPKKARVREYTLAGCGTGLLLLFGVYWWWSSHAELDMQIASAKTLEKQKKDQVEASRKIIKHREDVDKFLAGSINWLDEIAYVSSKIPPSEDVMLSNPTFDLLTDKQGSSGQIIVIANAKSAETIDRLKRDVSDKEHAVTGAGPKQLDQKVGDYGWTEKEIIRVTSTGWDPAPRGKTASAKTKPASASEPSPGATAPTSPTATSIATAAATKQDDAGTKPTESTPPVLTPTTQTPLTQLPQAGTTTASTTATETIPKPATSGEQAPLASPAPKVDGAASPPAAEPTPPGQPPQAAPPAKSPVPATDAAPASTPATTEPAPTDAPAKAEKKPEPT